MANSPFSESVARISFSILVDGKEIKGEYGVEKLVIEKEVGKVSKAKIVFIDGDPASNTFPISESPDLIPGKAIKIKLGYDSKEEDVFEGVITSQSLKAINYAHKNISNLIVTCHDKSFKMGLVPKTINHKDKKDSEIISSVISTYGLTKAVDATKFKHPNLVQYNSTDWDFVLERAKANGLIVLCNAGKLEVKAPMVSGSPVLDLDYGSNIISFNAELNGKSQIQGASFESWTSTTQKNAKGAGAEASTPVLGNIAGTALSKDAGKPELSISTSAPEDAVVLKAMADAEVLFSRFSKIQGTVTFVGSSRPDPGKLIGLGGFGARFNGSAFISRVTHEINNGFWKTHVGFGLDYSPDNPVSATRINKTPSKLQALPGLHIGKVKQIDKDPDGEFRVLVDVPIIKETGDGVWARLTSPYSSNGIGFYFFPELGDEVILGFLGNDPRFPIIVGSAYSKKNAPANTPEKKNEIKSLVTKSKMKIEFQEKDKIITIETPGGQKVTLDDKAKSLKLEDQNKNKVTLDSKGITLDSGKDIILKAKGKVSVSATGNATIDSKGDVSITGNNVKSKAKIALKAEGAASAELKASGNVVVKGSMVNIN
ncbi:MAG: type VI secretion system tip protein VgrG [Flavobacteriales bacterium]|jgi:Rhs element Vgr protein|nr:type VI secretion system tip protein VgrG [Flavobacteriales bacterium]MBT7749433.1 type VI secretion system tip protein VgrG [Flavobacteriales bacterium]NCG29636.1 type VI secretion system tip protein VgrG [Bacteroidota bacterium]